MKERSTREAFLLTMTTPPQPSNCKALIFTIKHYESFMLGSLSLSSVPLNKVKWNLN